MMTSQLTAHFTVRTNSLRSIRWSLKTWERDLVMPCTALSGHCALTYTDHDSPIHWPLTTAFTLS